MADGVFSASRITGDKTIRRGFHRLFYTDIGVCTRLIGFSHFFTLYPGKAERADAFVNFCRWTREFI